MNDSNGSWFVDPVRRMPKTRMAETPLVCTVVLVCLFLLILLNNFALIVALIPQALLLFYFRRCPYCFARFVFYAINCGRELDWPVLVLTATLSLIGLSNC